jgi:tetratricopeptide (TPR) repeat protein
LEAAERYGDIAPTAPHAAHMPAHIFARLGMWQKDIDSNLASVAASQAAAERHESGVFNQFHADDFLLYAYLQSGEDAGAKGVLHKTAELLAHFGAMPQMAPNGMAWMMPYYRSKFPVFYDLEMRDWKSAAALEPVTGAPPEVQTLTYWARIMGAGHLHQAQAAQGDLTKYEALVVAIKRGKRAYFADSTGAQIEHSEVVAWAAFAEGNTEKALKEMRDSANLQDKVGQGEVDIPAREMLADMLLELHEPKQALVEYDLALTMSPNRFNGLFNAGLASEAAGNKPRARKYYSALLKTTGNGQQSERAEFAHVKAFLSSSQVASK